MLVRRTDDNRDLGFSEAEGARSSWEESVRPMLSVRGREVIGVGITLSSYQKIVECCEQWLSKRRYIAVTAAYDVVSSILDDFLRQCVRDADVATPEGIPIVWSIQSCRTEDPHSLSPSSLIVSLCGLSAEMGRRVLLYGRPEGARKELEKTVRAKFPQIQLGVCASARHWKPEDENHSFSLFMHAVGSTRHAIRGYLKHSANSLIALSRTEGACRAWLWLD